MLWLNEHKRIWRIIILVLLLITFIGPWTFERLPGMAQFGCSPPNIWLDGDSCGIPLSGMWILAMVIGSTINIVVRTVTRASPYPKLAREFLMHLFFLLTLLPVFSALFLILSEEKPRYQVFHVAVWALAIVSGLWILLSSTPGPPPIQLWGLWGYIVLAPTALILEIAAMVSGKRPFLLKR